MPSANTLPAITGPGPAGPCNVGRQLQQWAAPLLPGHRTALRPAAVTSRAASSAPTQGVRESHRELQAVADGISRQLIGWGTALGFSRLLQQLEGMAPGCTLPWAAYAGFSALGAAARGELARAIQTLPFAALAPAALQDALRHVLRAFLPPGNTGLLHHEDVVLGLAACALLHELTRDRPVQHPASFAGQALLRQLSHLRTLLSVYGGLQRICNRAAPSGAPQLAGPRARHPIVPTREASSANLAAWPGTLREPCLPSSAAGLLAELPVTAWPFAGATAHPKGKGDGAPPPKKPLPPKKPSLPVGRPRSRSLPATRLGFTARRGSESQNAIRSANAIAGMGFSATAGASAGASASANGGAGGSVAGVEQNKEVMFPGLSRAVARHSRHPTQQARKATGKAASSPAGTAGIAAVGHRLRHGHGAGARASAPADGTPACLRFRGADRARHLLEKSRFGAGEVRFCIPAADTMQFQQAVDLPVPGNRWKAPWSISRPIREQYAPALQQAPIRRYNGLHQLRQAALRDGVAVGTDSIASVASISLVPRQQLLDHRMEADRVLEPNSFALVTHLELDGDPQHLIAWCVQRPLGVEAGIRAGWSVVESDDAGFHLSDPDAGFTFASDTLRGLMEGIARVSGCRWMQAADGALLDAPSGPPGTSLNLFIAEESTQRARIDPVPAFNPRMRFIEPTTVELSGGGSFTLLRASFVVLENHVLARAADGGLHSLGLPAVAGEPGRHRLQTRSLRAAAFAANHGLSGQRSYRMEEVVDLLEQHGLVDIRLEPVLPEEDPAAAEGFRARPALLAPVIEAPEGAQAPAPVGGVSARR